MTRKYFFTLFLIIGMLSCTNQGESIADAYELNNDIFQRLLRSNRVFNKLIKAENPKGYNNEKYDSKIIDGFNNYLENGEDRNIIEKFNKLLEFMEKFDPEYYNREVSEGGFLSRSEILKYFKLLKLDERKYLLSISVNHFLEHLVTQLSTEITRKDEDVFVAVVSDKDFIKRGERFRSKVVIGQKMKTINGEIELKSFKILVKDGEAKLELFPPKKAGEPGTVTKMPLNMTFNTIINGRDTVIDFYHEYYIKD